MLLSFPPLDAENFRYRPELGGGAIWDVGPYLVATSRVFFGQEPVSADCRVLAQGGKGVDIAFSALGTFSEGRSLTGHFGFDTAYCNRLQLIGPTVSLELDRAFTTPGDFANTIHATANSQKLAIEVPAADSFAGFFEHVIDRIGDGDWGQLTEDLLMDARSLEDYRAAAGVL
jgi:dTDP-3,4-didehydro-2,6-dideoxy-alpha-D-glucose 3-reductase